MSLEPKKKAEKRVNQRSLILGMLLKSGKVGCSTEELLQVSHRFSARIWELREKGFVINNVDREESDCKYYVLQEPDPTPTQPELFTTPGHQAR